MWMINIYILNGLYIIIGIYDGKFVVNKPCFDSGGDTVLYPSIFSRNMIYLGPVTEMMKILYEE